MQREKMAQLRFGLLCVCCVMAGFMQDTGGSRLPLANFTAADVAEVVQFMTGEGTAVAEVAASLANSGTASNVSSNTTVQQLEPTLANPNNAGPIYYKTAEAALYTVAAAARDITLLPSADLGQVLPLVGGGSLLLVGTNLTNAVTLAFQGPGDYATAQQINASEVFAPLSAAALAAGNFTGAYNASAASADPILALVKASAATPFATVVAGALGDVAPLRVVTTGYRSGGAMAQAAAIWAATAFPAAQIRCITFGSPQVGNEVFDWAFQELVDLSYTWSLGADLNYTNATTASGNYTDEVRVLPGNGTDTSLQAYINALEAGINASATMPLAVEQGPVNATAVAINDTGGLLSSLLNGTNNGSNPLSNFLSAGKGDISSFLSSIGDTGGSLGDHIGSFFGAIKDAVQAAGAYVFRGDTSSALDNSTAADAALARSEATGCPVILCKVRPAATQVCNVYNNGSNTIAPGSVTLMSNISAVAAVGWSAGNRTATIVFRGTTNAQDWREDFQIFLDQAPLNSVLQRVWPDARVHQGFLNQFESLSSQATSPQSNISYVLNQLSGGVTPNRVVVSGHSLGAGVASIASTWAAMQWPTADVQCITFGSPAPGNAQFAEAFKALVGRQRRVIDKLDVVPSLPPFEGYTQVEHGIWMIDNTTIALEGRPPQSFSILNWNDHNCREYETLAYRNLQVWPPAQLNVTY